MNDFEVKNGPMITFPAEVVITPKLKERFCKDTGIPVKIFEEPYFTNRLLLYDKYFNCVEKYKHFFNLVEKCGGEQQYFEVYNKLKDAAINHLKEQPNMIFFAQEEDMNQYKITHTGFPKNDIYKFTNDEREFISFDMRKGNFSSLYHYCPEIFNGHPTYEEFMDMFTDSEYLKSSKYIRQVIFGNINPRRQTTYEQYLMDHVMNDVLETFPKENVVFFSTDEIVVDISNLEKDNINKAIEYITKKNNENKINIRGERFVLHKINGIDGYIREFNFPEKKIDFKCIDSINMPFVIRALEKETIKEVDKIFIFNGVKAKLIDCPSITVPEINNLRENVEKSMDVHDEMSI